MSDPWDPNRGDLELLFDLIVRLPDHQWDDFRNDLHRLMQDVSVDAGSIEELLRKISLARPQRTCESLRRRADSASTLLATLPEEAQREVGDVVDKSLKELIPHQLELMRSMFAIMTDEELRQVEAMIDSRRRELA